MAEIWALADLKIDSRCQSALIQPMQSSYQAKIALQPVSSLINFAERQGVAREAILASGNLSESQLLDTRLLLDVQRFEDMFAFISEQLQDPLVGFRMGCEYDPSRWGVLGLIVLNCQDMATAMESQYRFQSLSGNMGAPIVINQGGLTTVQWVPAYNCSHFPAELIVTGMVSLSRTLMNRPDYQPKKVVFTHKAKGDVREYEAYFGCQVEFDGDYNGIQVSSEVMKSPLRKADAELYKILVQYANSLVTQQSFSSPMEVIKDYVVKTLPSHVPDIEEVAQYLKLSVRSTQRKLQEYGTSYSHVLDSIRKELALTYLRQTHNSVLYISERLGFSEQSAFQRAFKRWTGQTPRQFRMAHLEKPD